MFENEKIRLRKLASEDYLTYHQWRNDTEVMKSTYPLLDQYTLKETEDFIAMISSQPTAKSYIIEAKENNQAVGIISLIELDYKNRSGELIIDIGDKNSWGKGFGNSAITLLLNLVFNELNLNRLSLQVFSFNDRAIKLYKKVGFMEEGRLRQTLYREGKWHDTIVMSLLQNEYQIKNQL